MKERAFNAKDFEARAILEGMKTQTRRVVKPQPAVGAPITIDPWQEGITAFKPGRFGIYREGKPLGRWGLETVLDCPYGQPGDRLWVRETWMPCNTADGEVQVLYKASNDLRPDGVSIEEYGAAVWYDRPSDEVEKFRDAIDKMDVYGDVWRPSIHMPRWASRITLEVVSVRVERLQEISEEDAKAEGVYPFDGDSRGIPHKELHITSFCSLWKSINGATSWYANPYVWVVEFKKV